MGKVVDDVQYLISEKHAHRLALILRSVCFLIAVLAVLVIVLVLLGRVELSMTTPDGHFDRALLLEKDHSVTSRFLFTKLSNQTVFLTTHGSVGFVSWLFISLMGIVRVLPMGLSFFLLSRFFRSISAGKVFIAPNAGLLLRCGVLLIVSFFLVPLLNGLVFPYLHNRFSANRLILSVSPDFNSLFIGIVLLVMAYVFSYGIYLQD
jgi:hypothetical protein